MRCIRVVVADRYPLVRRGLLDVFDLERDFRVVACCGDALSFVEAIRRFLPEIAILDVELPDLDRPEARAMISSENLPTRIVLFAASAGDPYVSNLAEAGAHTVLSKDIEPAILTRVLRRIADNARSLPSGSDLYLGAGDDGALQILTHREHQIIRLVAEGMSNKEIGRQLNISDGTIKVQPLYLSNLEGKRPSPPKAGV